MAEHEHLEPSAQAAGSRRQKTSALSFEHLVELHYAALYRFALSLTRAESEACDLVQDAFLTWATKGHQLQDLSKVKTWLFTTLHRRFLEGQRRHTRFHHLELSEVESELPNVGPDAISRLDGSAVVALLGRLEPQFRSAVALFYLEDYSYNEIAAVLEVPLGTVKSRIARGLGQLKELLKNETSASGGNEEKSP